MNTELRLRKVEDGYMLVSFPDNMIKKINSILKIVTHIGPNAFKDSSIETIELPQNIVSIGEDAFYNCTKLKSVKINGKVKEIPNSCFAFCRSLKDVHLPSTVEKISDKAFYFCLELNNLEFPINLKEIGNYCFNQTKINTVSLLEGCIVGVGKELNISFIKTKKASIIRDLIERYMRHEEISEEEWEILHTKYEETLKKMMYKKARREMLQETVSPDDGGMVI